MLRRTLNLGILAHVDAGKTTLTERLLYDAGAIDAPGSVDAGTTQTDTLDLERLRGITIRSAVASFAVGDVDVNVLDTPGHPDFIAEVERVLRVLDGAVLVVSAVEGVQSQTRVLMRALRRLGVPTIVFANKIDRPGADEERVVHAIERRLGIVAFPMGTTRELGTPAASFVPEALDSLPETLASETRRAVVHPVLFGSAITGAGVHELAAAMVELLSVPAADDAPVSGSVFKVERGPRGEKLAYVRLFAGTIRVRDRLAVGGSHAHKVTSIRVVEPGRVAERRSVRAGQIAIVGGLRNVRVGDAVGVPRAVDERRQFALPTLETLVAPQDAADRGRLRVALGQLAEQDPLISVRQDDRRQELSVLLYGEVQKEVLGATLEAEYGIGVAFGATTPVHVERVAGAGEAVEVLRAETKSNVTGKSSPTSTNPFVATLGLRVEPAPTGAGLELRLAVDVRLVPVYVFKTVPGFVDHMTSYVHDVLQEGLFGWQIPDCTVTVIECGYRAPGTTAGDFRKLTPIVLMRALVDAGSIVCEPTVRAELEIPTDTIGTVIPALARLGAAVEPASWEGDLCTITTVIRVTEAYALRWELPSLTRGEGVLETSFCGYEPVRGTAPARARTTASPLDLEAYLAELAGRR